MKLGFSIHFIFLLLLTLFVFTGNAQTVWTDAGDPEIHVSQPFDTQGTHLYYVPKFYITTEEKIVAVIPVGGVWHPSYVIQYFDRQSGELISAHEEKIDNRDIFVENALLIDHRLYIFYSEYDKISDQEQLFTREIIYSEPGQLGKETLLITTNGKVRTNSEYNYSIKSEFNRPVYSGTIAHTNSGKFYVYPSSDNTHFAVKYSLHPQKKADAASKEEMGIAVFDSELGKVWEKLISMPYTEANMVMKTIALDANKTVNLLIKHKPKLSSDGIEVVILKVHPDGSTETYPLNSEGIYVEDVQFAVGKNNTICIAGYYRLEPKKHIIGAFTAILYPDGAFEKAVTFPFEFETITQFESISANKLEKAKSDHAAGEFGFFHLKASSISFLNDGTVLFSGHRYRNSSSPSMSFDLTTYSTSGRSGISGSNYQSHGAIITIKFQADLEEKIWESKVPLNTSWPIAHTLDHPFFINAAYRMLIDDKNAIFILPESEKNAVIENDKELKAETAPYSTIRIYQVDLNTGDKKRYSFATANKIGESKVKNFSPERVALKGNNQVFIEMTGARKTSNLYQVTLNK